MEPKEAHWKELLGNKYKYGLHPSMLTEEGYKLKTVASLEGYGKSDRFPVTITFDEEYVVEVLSRVLERLQPSKYNQFQGLVSKAYARWNEKKEQD